MPEATTPYTKGIILAGHGAIPIDYARELVTRLRTLEAQRRTAGGEPTAEEQELETRLRHWPRTPQTDPYQSGLASLASHLQQLLPDTKLSLAYLEFCAPTLTEAVDELVAAGVTEVTVVPSMLTPGGVHSEVDIPAILEHLRHRYPVLALRYAWPFDQDLVAGMLATHLAAFPVQQPHPERFDH